MIRIYSGDGRGKSSAALGNALECASEGNNVVIVRFLKGNVLEGTEFWQRLAPGIKIFYFEKSNENFCDLTEEKKSEEIGNIRNGLNFARKVLSTGECKLLILDEVLGLIDTGILSVADLKTLLCIKNEETDIIMTGISFNEEIGILADEVSRIVPVKG